MIRWIAARISRGAAHVKETAGLAAGLAWLAWDHARRKLTGRPGLFEELDFTIELDEADVTPPFDNRDRPEQKAPPPKTPRGGKGR